MPTALISVLLPRRLPDRHVLIIALCVYLTGTLIKINYHYKGHMAQAQFYIGSAIVFIGSILAEASVIAILAKIIPARYKKRYFNAGLLSGTGDTLGRAIGNALFTGFSRIDTLAAYPCIWYSTASGILAFCLMLVLVYNTYLQKHSVLLVKAGEIPVVTENGDMEIERLQ